MLSETAQVSSAQVTIIQDRQYVYLQKGYTKQSSINKVFQWIHSSTDYHLSRNTSLWWNAQKKTSKTSEWQPHRLLILILLLLVIQESVSSSSEVHS